MGKKSTGKTITEHAIDSLNEETLKQTYLPVTKSSVAKSKIKNPK